MILSNMTIIHGVTNYNTEVGRRKSFQNYLNQFDNINGKERKVQITWSDTQVSALHSWQSLVTKLKFIN